MLKKIVPNERLAKMIFYGGYKQVHIAYVCSMAESTLSKIKSGLKKATQKQKEQLAYFFKCEIADLFPDGEEVEDV